MKYFLTTLTSAVTLCFLTSCNENPADNVESAKVEAVGNQPVSTSREAPPSGEKKIFVLSDTSKIEWVGSKVTGSHEGGFSNFNGKFEVLNGELLEGGKHSVSIDMASVYTDNERLTEHLKGEDFFDVKKYPIARFNLRKAELIEGDQYTMSGILDLHGVAKQISFPATMKITEKETLIDMQAEFSINRKDFDIVYPGKPDDLIRDEVVMKFAVSALPGEPTSLVLMDETEGDDGKGKGGKGGKGKGDGKGKGKGGKGKGDRPDWRNMSEEERREARARMLAEMDTNKDGMLGKDEVPERVWSFMGRADANGDNKLSEAERADFREQMAAERELRELTGEGGGGGGFRGGKGGKGGGGKGGGGN